MDPKCAHLTNLKSLYLYNSEINEENIREGGGKG